MDFIQARIEPYLSKAVQILSDLAINILFFLGGIVTAGQSKTSVILWLVRVEKLFYYDRYEH
ncbi:uncharacterized protein BDW43DRAFT_278957 [Aspergillus alliaceus]|uniref:uncharacterized protein n=1 Tax=Petromyces alliaceus TaxID=209559 RepID=UPI0012A75C86|nr:uncharacterized protein BDW43DRAFT_278957 [Aspergillus alliaceus]KAB8232561.1 hypothetical protein BDW43DRAFT_278957 [Aspergillus alliaceus]